MSNENVKQDSTMDIYDMISSTEEKPVKKSPLEQMIEQKEKQPKGMIVNNSDVTVDGPKVLKGADENDETVAGVNETINELDGMISALENNTLTSKPKNPMETVALMDQLSYMAANGVKDTVIDPNKGTIEAKTKVDTPKDETSAEDKGEEPVEIPTEDKKKEDVVNILIDKTGLGANFNFTDEKREKIQRASTLRVTEVHNLELPTNYAKKEDKSFNQLISQHIITSSQTPVVFPASKYKGQLKGLSFGELNDIALDNETTTVDRINKKFSIIYNNLINTSIGKFESYEDFLKNTAFTDIDMFTFGLICSTFPEDDSLALNCRVEGCGKEFNVNYSPRNLIRFKRMNDTALNSMQKILDAETPEEAKALHETSSVKRIKEIQLPHSKYILGIGLASAYDYLHGVASIMLNGDKWKQDHPDDVNGTKYATATFLTFVRYVIVPGGGEYYKFTDNNDIIEALYALPPEESAILFAMLEKFTAPYSPVFGLEDVTCPHCGAKSAFIPIDINDMVFLKSRMLGATSVDLTDILEI